MIKEFREFLKERHQYKIDTRRLEQLTLDYEALKRIVQAVETSNVTITLELKDGAKMVISKQATEQIPFKTFAELYNQQRGE